MGREGTRRLGGWQGLDHLNLRVVIRTLRMGAMGNLGSLTGRHLWRWVCVSRVTVKLHFMWVFRPVP